MPEVPKVLTAWSYFYVITGSSAAALTGLMFVVITLVAGQERLRKQRDGVSLFSTPTVVHFCAALLVSAILTAPWRSLTRPAVMLALTGLFGVVYVIGVVLRMRRRWGANPQPLEDWFWYGILPFVPYVTIVAAALLLAATPTDASFALAGATMVLIFIGIRNAWDSVTFIAIDPGDDA
jgi:cytochrome bd-type quinol oxidase subunit 2